MMNLLVKIMYHLGLCVLLGFLKIIINPIHFLIKSRYLEYYIYMCVFVWIVLFIIK